MRCITGFISGKAAPTVVASNGGGNAVVNNSKTNTLPTGIAAGDIILMSLMGYSDSGVTMNVPSGFTSLASQASGRTHMRLVYKVANGTEGGTNITISANLNHFAAWTNFVVRGAGVIEASTGATAASGAPDSPSISPAWGLDNNLFIATEGAYGTTVAQSAPSGYSGFVAGTSNSGGVDWARIGTAWKQSAAASENPPAFPNAIGTSGITAPVWYAWTVGFMP